MTNKVLSEQNLPELKFTEAEDKCLKAAAILLRDHGGEYTGIGSNLVLIGPLNRTQPGFGVLLNAVNMKYQDCVTKESKKMER